MNQTGNGKSRHSSLLSLHATSVRNCFALIGLSKLISQAMILNIGGFIADKNSVYAGDSKLALVGSVFGSEEEDNTLHIHSGKII